MAEVVVDASALVDLLLGQPLGTAVDERLRGERLHLPAHADAEVLSALGRLHRAGRVNTDQVSAGLAWLDRAPLARHPVAPLLTGAWGRRDRVRLVDGLYLELAAQLGATLITTDRGLRNESGVETVEV